ncbi:MAG: HNH endonuclease signature motif containing protein [Promethearchaeota archaeon]
MTNENNREIDIKSFFTSDVWKRRKEKRKKLRKLKYKEEGELQYLERKARKIQNKRGYSGLIESDVWKEAKWILFKREARKYPSNKSMTKTIPTVKCARCGKELDDMQAVMHHINYETLFSDKNIQFVCYDCHRKIHKEERSKKK